MSHRSFTDRDGVRWQVWDVTPQWADRRLVSDRRRQAIEDLPDPPALDQRLRGDRRSNDAPLGTPRVRIPGTFAGGWLAFESQTEKRRLSPIPDGWQSASEADLARWCASAISAPKRRLID